MPAAPIYALPFRALQSATYFTRAIVLDANGKKVAEFGEKFVIGTRAEHRQRSKTN